MCVCVCVCVCFECHGSRLLTVQPLSCSSSPQIKRQLITHLEIRTEQSLDVVQYVNERKVRRVFFSCISFFFFSFLLSSIGRVRSLSPNLSIQIEVLPVGLGEELEWYKVQLFLLHSSLDYFSSVADLTEIQMSGCIELGFIGRI